MKYPTIFLFIALTLATLKISTGKNIVLKFENADHFENRRPNSDNQNMKRNVRSDQSKIRFLMNPIYEILDRYKNPHRVHGEKQFVDLTRTPNYIDGVEPIKRPKAAINYLKVPANALEKKNINPLKSALTVNNYNLLLELAARKMIPFQKSKNTRYSSKETDSDYSEEDSDPYGDSEERHRDRDVNDEENSEEENDEQDRGTNEETNTEAKPARFEVSSNTVEVDKESNESDESDGDNEHYMQVLTRLLKTKDIDWRRTIPKFLPKRVLWDAEDYQKL